MTVVDAPRPTTEVPAAHAEAPRGVNLRPTVFLAVGALLFSGLILAVGPMIWRSPGVKIPAGTTRVNVSLFDFGIRLDSSTSPRAGKDAFVITNTGKIRHELVGFATTDSATGLPLRTDGDVNEESSQLQSVIDTGDSLVPGQTKVIVATLSAGTHYVLICNLPGHWHAGMRIDMTPS
jgi:hypothetical protein